MVNIDCRKFLMKNYKLYLLCDFFHYLGEILTKMLTDGNDVEAIDISAQKDDLLIDAAACAMVVAEPTQIPSEDSGIQATTPSSLSESHSDSVELIENENNDKNGKNNSKLKQFS